MTITFGIELSVPDVLARLSRRKKRNYNREKEKRKNKQSRNKSGKMQKTEERTVCADDNEDNDDNVENVNDGKRDGFPKRKLLCQFLSLPFQSSYSFRFVISPRIKRKR